MTKTVKALRSIVTCALCKFDFYVGRCRKYTAKNFECPSCNSRFTLNGNLVTVGRRYRAKYKLNHIDVRLIKKEFSNRIV